MAGRRRKGTWGGARPGSGPKPILKDPVMRSVSFEREQAETVQKVADEKELSFAEIVRRALDAYLKRRRR